MTFSISTKPVTEKLIGFVVFTIYCHTHTETGRRYIGLTKLTMMKRWNQHVRNSRKKKGYGCRYFWNTIRFYGKDAFSHEVLEVCRSLEVANLAEECWIELYETRDPAKGFNFRRGGYHQPHPIRNPWERPDYREKMIAASKAGLNTPESKARRSAASKDLWSNPEFREKNRQAVIAAHANPETREKIAAANRGKVLSPETRAKISKSSKRWASSPEFRAVMSSSEVRKKISDALKGRTLRPDSITKIREAARSKPLPTHCGRGHSLDGIPVVMKETKRGPRRIRRCPLCRKHSSSELYPRP